MVNGATLYMIIILVTYLEVLSTQQKESLNLTNPIHKSIQNNDSDSSAFTTGHYSLQNSTETGDHNLTVNDGGSGGGGVVVNVIENNSSFQAVGIMSLFTACAVQGKKGENDNECEYQGDNQDDFGIYEAITLVVALKENRKDSLRRPNGEVNNWYNNNVFYICQMQYYAIFNCIYYSSTIILYMTVSITECKTIMDRRKDEWCSPVYGSDAMICHMHAMLGKEDGAPAWHVVDDDGVDNK